MTDQSPTEDPIRAAREEVVRSDVRPAHTKTPGERPGDVIDRYKLLEQIGEGGMGSVWMAEQREPVKRRIALKIIKLGMDTKQVVARFEAERQALAMMDHPHIAKVLDAGATGTGRLYFVMEYIKGIPILEYCDQEKVDTKARLLLFASVCHAIQHAHQKGIIHRDIKPSNVLVTLHDGVPVCKVIDFGIAKATNAELTTKTLFTEHRQMVGTPAYMSPEQAEMSGLDIDTRSDIYSLGVLLYELLTGTTPFDMKGLLAKGFAEMMRTIREDQPHKPSTRISTLGDTGTRTALQRKVDLKRLGTLLRGDLDWIVMKCLEKDRSRRYETANGLAADITRHLRDEPVVAGPPSASYRLRKFVRRHKARVVAGCLVAATLVLGVIGTTTGMLHALAERRRANDEAGKATLAAENEAKANAEAQDNERHAIAEAARAKAAKEEEARSRKRAETIAAFVTEALKTSDAVNQGGRQDTTILEAMGRAIADLDSGRFADDPATEAGLRVTIGAILRNNGRLREAEVLLTQALETERRLDGPKLAATMNELALVKDELGNKAEARQLLVAALELDRRNFSGDHPAIARGLCNLAITVPPEEAEPLLRQALAMDQRLCQGDSDDIASDQANLASVLQAMGRTAEAEPLFAAALETQRRLFKGDHPFVAKNLDNLGKARLALGRRAEAVDLLTQALAMRRRLFKGPHPDLATGLHNLAAVLKEEGRLAEAEPLYAEALEMRQRLFEGDNLDVAFSLSTLAGVLHELGQPAEAEPLYVRALGIRQRLAKGDDAGVFESLRKVAGVRLELDQPAEAEPLCVQALDMGRRLLRGDHADIAACLTDLGYARVAQGRAAEAGPLLVQALEMYRRLEPRDDPTTAKSLDNLGKAFQGAGRLVEAEALLAQSLAMRERLYKGDHADLAKGLNNLGSAQAAGRRFAEAEATQRRALEMLQRLFHGDHADLAMVLENLAILLRDSGRPAQAEPFELQAVEMYQRLAVGDSPRLALALFSLGTIREAAGHIAAAVPPYEAAMQMNRRRLPADHPHLLVSMTRLAQAYYGVGSYDKAIPLLEEALQGQETTIGRQDPQTLMTIGNLGANYRAAGRFAEAVPLLEEARKHSKQYPQLRFVDWHLLDACVHAADPASERDTARATTLADELLTASRSTLAKESPELARDLAIAGMALIDLKAWDTAEPLLREALAIRDKRQPDAWTTFNTRSVLGGALLGQKKYADAEPLLLAGYRGLKERAATIDANGASRIPQALDRLVQLYEAMGNATEAAAWRAEREAARPPESRPATDGSKR